jgi:hypothetical protein
MSLTPVLQRKGKAPSQMVSQHPLARKRDMSESPWMPSPRGPFCANSTLSTGWDLLVIFLTLPHTMSVHHCSWSLNPVETYPPGAGAGARQWRISVPLYLS